ncbi:TPA: hypothetical protein HA336_04805 [Methanopyrus kandleri]|uniref:Zn-dependent metallo-hydrolase RNA specificity domain-containing protein n=1 Tax=Methanopyrus kandleri TaxID=2320 RepID=A0A832WKW8_9EURY|nr:MBL fold metallo-hydrolase RNA specificity domain-containing protein [Methanopyrus kandleri]HII70535.1 hypothetical protein [Methanopyrus kandleri]
MFTDRPRYPLLLSDPRLIEERLPKEPKVVITERWFLYRSRKVMRELERSVPYYYVVSETGHATESEIRRLVEELRPRHVILRHGPLPSRAVVTGSWFGRRGSRSWTFRCG